MKIPTPQNLLQRAVGGGLVHTPSQKVPYISPQQRQQNELKSYADEMNSRGPVYVRSKSSHGSQLINDDLNQSGKAYSSFYYPETETGNRSDTYYDYENDDLTSIHRMGIGTGDEKMAYNDQIYNVRNIPYTDRYAYPEGTPGADIYNQYYHGPLEEGDDWGSMQYGTSSSDDLWNLYYPDNAPKTYNEYTGKSY